LRRPLDEAYRSSDAAEEYYTRHRRSAVRKIVSNRETLLISRLLAEVPKKATVLDAACGTGRISSALRDMGWRIVSVDASKDMLQKGLEGKTHLKNAAVNGSIYQIPLCDGSMTGAVSIRFFHHLPDRRLRLDALNELKRVSAGPIVVSIWTGFNFQALRRKVKIWRGRRPSLRFSFKLNDFSEEAATVGLEVKKVLFLYRFVSETAYLLLAPTDKTPGSEHNFANE